jgi:hypothetical protein
MHKIAIGLYSLLFLSVFPGPIAAQEAPTAQATPEQSCDYSLVFVDDRCEVRTNAPGGADQITMSRRDSAANPYEKRVADNSTPQR